MYRILYSCISHVGKIRSSNQDNFICDRQYLNPEQRDWPVRLCGEKTSVESPLFGVFDGMGGEECGEIASYIAAKGALKTVIGKKAASTLSEFIQKANSDICDFAEANGIISMGTTAALLAFTKKAVFLCNIGDSKIFRLSGGVLEQISKDHVVTSAFGLKPPLSQNLGISPNEMLIEPFLARGPYQDGDIYLICSDGLTDMVPTEIIQETLNLGALESAADSLLELALSNGGKDNISVILCEIQSCSPWPFIHKTRTDKRGK